MLQNLSEELRSEFGKGYSKRNLEHIRKFYLTYRFAKSPISQSLTWTQYLNLMRIENAEERAFYEIETVKNIRVFRRTAIGGNPTDETTPNDKLKKH